MSSYAFRRVWMKGIRNLSERVFECRDQDPVVILGQNNQGKSNFLEALHLVMTGKSPFEPILDRLIQFDSSEMVIVADIDRDGDKTRFSYKMVRDGVTLGLKGADLIRSYLAVKKQFPIIFMSSDLFYTFRESPQARRHNLDRFCEMFFSDYGHHLRRYNRVLKQKTEVLKSGGNREQLFFWNEQLVQFASEIVSLRVEALSVIGENYHQLSLEFNSNYFSDLKLNYIPSGASIVGGKEEYCRLLIGKLSDNLDKEVMVGYNLYGPHRDDYEIEIGGKNLFSFFSRGVNKLVSFSLSVAQIEALYSQLGVYPILLLDDPFSEMDFIFKQNAIKLIQKRAQIFYTTVLDQDCGLFDNPQIYRMISGSLVNG